MRPAFRAWLGVMRSPRSSKMRPARPSGGYRTRSLRARRQYPRSFQRCSVPRSVPSDDRRAGHSDPRRVAHDYGLDRHHLDLCRRLRCERRAAARTTDMKRCERMHARACSTLAPLRIDSQGLVFVTSAVDHERSLTVVLSFRTVCETSARMRPVSPAMIGVEPFCSISTIKLPSSP